MTALTLDGQAGTAVQIDLCDACQAFWFDRYESLRLTPGSTLRLFSRMGQQRPAGAPTRPGALCPRCGGALRLTHDRQQSTPFVYWRCERGHGRFISFLDFLRQKDFIRPLTLQQVAALRDNLQAVNCANCGAPVDLARETVCGHCGSPLSMIDVPHMQRMVEQLKKAAAPRPLDPALPMRLEQVRRETEEHFAAASSRGHSWSLVGDGLRLLGQWLAAE